MLRPPERRSPPNEFTIERLGTSAAAVDAVHDLLTRCSPRDRLMRAGTVHAHRAVPWLLPRRPGDVAVAAYLTGAGRLIGVANLNPSDEQSSELAVIVDPQWRSKGVARRMCQALLAFAPPIVIATVDTSNTAAQRLAGHFTDQAPTHIDGQTVEYTVRSPGSGHHDELADDGAVSDSLHRTR